jgi:hypothetical protein
MGWSVVRLGYMIHHLSLLNFNIYDQKVCLNTIKSLNDNGILLAYLVTERSPQINM